MHKPSNQQFAQIFDGIASRYNDVSNAYLVGKRKAILGSWARGRCLEVGAGTGEISRYLAKSHEVVATDISPAMVEEIKKHGIDPVRSRARDEVASPEDRGAATSNGVEAYVCDAEQLPFENETFDTVIAAEMLFYLDNPDNFLREAYRLLKPDGRLLISCASNFPVKLYDQLRSWLRRMGMSRGMYFKEDPLKEFMTPSKLKAMLVRHNFKIVEMSKSPILPIASLDFLNRILEKTPLKQFGIFIFTLATKQINN